MIAGKNGCQCCALLLAACLFAPPGSTQTVSAQTVDARPNAVYVELLGNAAVYSFNYERRLTGPVHARVGAGYLALPETDTDEVDGLGMVPVMVGWVSRSAPSAIELSVGCAAVLTHGEWDDVGILSSETRFVGTATLGYRYAPANNGLLLRVGFTPWFGADGFSPWGGASLGLRF